MNVSNKLIDKFATVCGASKDSDLAARLHVSKQAVSGWRTGKAHPDAESVEKMCVATGESIARWMPLVEAERARSPGARKAWLRLAQLGAAAAVIYTLSRLDVHHDVVSSVLLASRNPGTLYIM